MRKIILFLLILFVISKVYCQTPIQEVCAGSQHVYNIDNLNPELTYTWGIYNNQGVIKSLKTDNSAIEITWDNSAGIDSLWLVANDNSCQSDTSKLIVKRIALPTLSLENDELNDTLCISSTQKYKIQNFNANSNYSWGIYANTGTIVNENNENILISWDNSLLQDSIWFVEENELGCKGDTSVQKIIKTNKPNVNFSDTVICYGESLNLNFIGYPPFSVEYLFNRDTLRQNEINTVNFLFSHESGNYKLLNLNDKYCNSFALSENNTAYIDIPLEELNFDINFEFVDSVSLNEIKTYLVRNKSEHTLLKWEVSNGNILSKNPSQNDSISVLWNIEGIGLLKVYEETQNNCIGQLVSKEILIIKKEPTNDSQINLNIPNVFTPNGDGKNDVFEIKTNSLPKSFLLVIKNRWGRKVFESDDINNSWNGKINNKICSEGVYFYVIQFLNQNALEQKSGFVHLYR